MSTTPEKARIPAPPTPPAPPAGFAFPPHHNAVACPSWCEGQGEAFHRHYGTDHRRTLGQLAATASRPVDDERGLLFPRVEVLAYQEDAVHPTIAVLEIATARSGTDSVDLRPEQARQVAALLLAAADLLEAAAP